MQNEKGFGLCKVKTAFLQIQDLYSLCDNIKRTGNRWMFRCGLAPAWAQLIIRVALWFGTTQLIITVHHTLREESRIRLGSTVQPGLLWRQPVSQRGKCENHKPGGNISQGRSLRPVDMFFSVLTSEPRCLPDVPDTHLALTPRRFLFVSLTRLVI